MPQQIVYDDLTTLFSRLASPDLISHSGRNITLRSEVADAVLD